MGWAWIVLVLVAVQRLAELALARRNTARLLSEGAREAGAGHYPLFVLLHGGWLAALFATVPADAPVHGGLLALFVLLQLGRVWVIATLGRFWTTRIVTLDGAPLVRRGPFRWVRHPNYLVVAGELAVLPLVFGQVWVAVVFSLLNIPLTLHRIRVEEAALRPRAAPVVVSMSGAAFPLPDPPPLRVPLPDPPPLRVPLPDPPPLRGRGDCRR